MLKQKTFNEIDIQEQSCEQLFAESALHEELILNSSSAYKFYQDANFTTEITIGKYKITTGTTIYLKTGKVIDTKLFGSVMYDNRACASVSQIPTSDGNFVRICFNGIVTQYIANILINTLFKCIDCILFIYDFCNSLIILLHQLILIL